MTRVASWVIVSRQTGAPVMETFSKRVADAVNRSRYEVLPVLEWLHRFNRQQRKLFGQIVPEK